MIVADVVVLNAKELDVLELEPRPGWKPWRREELECQERRQSSMFLDRALTGSVKMCTICPPVTSHRVKISGKICAER